MNSEVLRKILVAGAAVAALSVVAQRKRDEEVPGGIEPGAGGLPESRGGSTPKRIDPG